MTGEIPTAAGCPSECNANHDAPSQDGQRPKGGQRPSHRLRPFSFLARRTGFVTEQARFMVCAPCDNNPVTAFDPVGRQCGSDRFQTAIDLHECRIAGSAPGQGLDVGSAFTFRTTPPGPPAEMLLYECLNQVARWTQPTGRVLTTA